jgi:hypothetical protein
LVEKSAHDALKKARAAFLSKTGMEFLSPPAFQTGSAPEKMRLFSPRLDKIILLFQAASHLRSANSEIR